MMKPLFIKICGVTSERDALMAADLGADAIGLNFYPKSPRYVSPAKARRIVEALPPFVWAIGIFVNETADTLYRVAEKARLDAVQLHGNERPALANGLHLRTLKALHVGTAGVERLATRFHVDALVLDAAQPGFGGGGITFDWKYAHALARKRPLVLAGGLTPDNVAEAVKAVHPFGVDVASGVEKSPGVKDSKKVKAFIQAARRAQ